MVEQRVRLQILSKADVDELENQVMRLENLALRKDTAQRKIRARKSKAGSGTQFGGSLDEVLPSATLKKRSKAEIGRQADAALANAQKNRKKRGAGPVDEFKEIKEKEFDKLKKDLAETKNKVGDIQEAVNDPISLLTRALTKNKAVAKIFAGTGIATLIINIVFTKVKEYFGEGGAGDVRKAVLDVVKAIPELALILDIRRGRVFFTADTRIRSSVASNSATQDLGSTALQYRELNIGSENLIG